MIGEPMEDQPVNIAEKNNPFEVIDLRFIAAESECETSSESSEDEGIEDAPTEEKQTQFTVLGETFEKSTSTNVSVPKWVQNAVAFSAKISARTGDGIPYLEGLDQSLHEKLSSIYSTFFPVQTAVLPELLRQSVSPPLLPPRDIVISAPTGSGKTLCYVLPILNYFSKPSKDKRKGLRGLILAPTRALVSQIYKDVETLNILNVNVVALNVTRTFEEEQKILFPDYSQTSDVEVIISTHTRFMEHLISRRKLDLTGLRYLVVDEADGIAMPRETFLNYVEIRANYSSGTSLNYKKLTDRTRNTRLQKIIVSATLHLEADKLHVWGLRFPRLYRADSKKVEEKRMKPLELEDNAGKNGESIQEEKHGNGDINNFALPHGLTQEIRICKAEYKPLLIYSYLTKNPTWKRVLIFVNDTQRLCLLLDKLSNGKIKIGEVSKKLYGNRRFRLLKKFSTGEVGVLISSGALARGMNIPDIDCVISYDPPIDSNAYVHRAGRTARAGQEGRVVTLVTPEEKIRIKSLLIKTGIWEDDSQNRAKDTEFIEEHKDVYQKALDALKQSVQSRASSKKNVD